MQAVQERPVTTKRTYAEATKWFDIWGRVVKERVLSGDISALPSFGGLTSGGGDGSPSDPSATLLTFAVVETFLAQRATPRQKLLAAFIHAFGIEERIVAVEWLFGDGSRSEPVPVNPRRPDEMDAYDLAAEATKRPVQAIGCEPVIRRRETYNLSLFKWPQLDVILLELRRDKEEFLEAEHRRLLRAFAHENCLDQYRP